MIKFNMTRRQSVRALAAGTVAFTLFAGMTFAENADVKIGYTPNGLDRSDGFAKKLAEPAPKVQIIQRPTEGTADIASGAAQNVLTQNPNLAGIFMASELMATTENVDSPDMWANQAGK